MNVGSSYLHRIREQLSKWEAFGPLLARASVGAIFFASGSGKLKNLDRVVEFFRSLGIPAPQLQAPFIAGLELLGGAALILGVFTRFFSFELACTMVVAIATARWAEVDGVVPLLSLNEFTYLALLLWLVLSGPGSFSLDGLLAQKWPHLLGVPAQAGQDRKLDSDFAPPAALDP